MNKIKTSRRQRLLAGLATAFTLLCSLGLANLTAQAQSAASRWHRLPGHVNPAEQGAQSLGAMPQSQTISLALVLPLRNEQTLDSLLAKLYDPASPEYGQFLTSQQFTDEFGPTPQEYAQVAAYARANGLTVTGAHPNRLVLDVEGPVGAVESAFGTRIDHFHSRRGRDFYGPESDPAIPASLAGEIEAVVGLDNATVWHTNSVALNPAETANATSNEVGTGPGGALTPSDIKKAYNLASTSLNGSGQTLAVFELDGYNATDIAGYASYFGLPQVPLQNILVDGASGAASGSGAAEVTLDIELQMAVAPGAAKIEVYEGPNSGQGVLDTYNRIATDNTAKEISTSWGAAEDQSSTAFLNSENTIFKQMAAQGQSIYASSGDSGAYDDGSSLSVDDPASQPYMVGVGGTHLTLASGAYSKESTWNNGSANAGAGGGGISAVWGIPSWQQGVVPAASEGSQTMRNVPDVAFDADPNTGYSIYYNGKWYIYGGTSCASPIWAAFTALVNQQRLANGAGYLGFADPAIYQIGKGSRYGSDFHDIADDSTNLFYPAVAGYDDATGWGSFNGAGLLADLAPSSTGSTGPINGTQSVRIDAGGGAVGSFAADSSFSGGSTWLSTQAISTAGVANAAPAAVYQTQRYGNCNYTIGGLTAGATYTVRLHFAETWFGSSYSWGGAGSRKFNVAINGQPVLTNFDVYATAGGANRALVETFTATANSGGKIAIAFTSVVSNAMIEGIEVVPPAGGSNGSGSGSGGTTSQTIAQINAGGGAVGPFSADTAYSGGSTWSTTVAISTAGVANAAPAAVYQTQRYGSFSYSFGGLTPGKSYSVRLHFAESWFGPGMPGGGGKGSRVFNVTVNGQPALTNLDVYSSAGGSNKALVETISAAASSAGVITLQFTPVVTNAMVEGIEVISG